MKQRIKRIPIVSYLMKGKLEKRLDLLGVPGFESINDGLIDKINNVLAKDGPPLVHILTKPFHDSLVENMRSFTENKEIFHSLDYGCNVLVIGNFVLYYEIERAHNGETYKTSFFVFNDTHTLCLAAETGEYMGNGDSNLKLLVHPQFEEFSKQEQKYNGLSQQDLQMSIFQNYFVVALVFNLFKKYAEVETKLLQPKEKSRVFNCKYYNDSDYQIQIMDSIWFTTLVKSDSFKVRGHFRFQACGQAFKDKKLIWIKDFKKEGYTRKARKELEIA
jgi:hypothetical protein